MGFHLTHRYGATESNPPLSKLTELYAELEDKDEEHPDVAVTHESEWCLSAYPNGSVVWENLEDGNHPRYMKTVSKEKLLELWTKLAKGDIASINTEPWTEGYPWQSSR